MQNIKKRLVKLEERILPARWCCTCINPPWKGVSVAEQVKAEERRLNAPIPHHELQRMLNAEFIDDGFTGSRIFFYKLEGYADE